MTYIVPALATVDGDTQAIRNSFAGILPAESLQISGMKQMQQALQTAAQQLLIQQVNADTTLPALTVSAALQVLIAQMVAGSFKVAGSTLSLTPTAGGCNVGNGPFVTSDIDGQARALQYQFHETINVANVNTTVPGGEVFLASGYVGLTDTLDSDMAEPSGQRRRGAIAGDRAHDFRFATDEWRL